MIVIVSGSAQILIFLPIVAQLSLLNLIRKPANDCVFGSQLNMYLGCGRARVQRTGFLQ